MSSPHDHPSTSFFVRAAFHYRATDASSIDLAEGDLIEVFSQLENGWWDGRLVTKCGCPRGWFPGTFVVPVSDDEAHKEIIFAIYRPIDGWFGLSSSDYTKAPNGEDITYMTSVLDDFWLPEHGRFMYRNSWTGEVTSSVPSPPVQIPGPLDRPSTPVSSFASSGHSKSDDSTALLKPKGDPVKPNFGSRAFRETGPLLMAPMSMPSASHPRYFFDVPLTMEEVNQHANSIRHALQELSHITRKAMGDARRRTVLYTRDRANKLVEKILRLLYIAGGLVRPCLSKPDELPRVGLPSPAFCTRHRNVIFALSHLILSLRDARHSSISITTGNQVIRDVTEMARTVFTLVRELACSSTPLQKVLEVMAPSSISAVESKSSTLSLDVVTLGIFKSLRSNVDEMFTVFRDISAQGVAVSGKNTELISVAVSQLSTLLACVESLDIPPLSELELTSPRGLRMDTVSHDMETTKTSLFNEGMLLLSTIRQRKIPSPVERTAPCVHGFTSSILRRVQQLEACLIELVFLNYWRTTRSSVPQLRPIPPPRPATNRSFRAPEAVNLEHSSSSSSSSKLSKVDEAPTSLSGVSTPEFFEAEQTAPPRSESESRGLGIFTNSDGSVRGGTLEALVEHLTPHDKQDFAFHNIFFLTLRSFTTVSEVFPLLVARFNVAPPDDLDLIQQENWTHKTRHLIRIRVIKAVISLLHSDGVVRPEDSTILDDIKAFAHEISVSYPSARRLVTLADIAKHRDPFFIRSPPAYEPVSPPLPRVPKVGSDRRLSLLDLDPLEVARQLTLKESALFKTISPKECFARAKECPRPHDSFSTCIALANQTAYWVCDEILHRQEPKGRATVIGHLINIAHHCRALNNFSSMTAIVAGLNSTPIHRLKRSWSEVKPKAMALFREVEVMVRSWKNLAEFRKAMTNVTGPCVPFLGVYLTALLFIQNGMKDTLDKEGKIINFAKHAKAAETVAEIQAYQATRYDLSIVPSIRVFIDKSLLVTATPDEFWELSLAREPRDSVPDVPSERKRLLMSSFVAF